MADERNHPRQRRALAHAFSKRALMEQEDILLGYVRKFISRLEGFARDGTPVNLVNWFNYTTFDIIGDLSFGEPFGCLAEGEGSESAHWVVLIYESIKSGAIEQATRRFARAGSLLQREKTIRRMETPTDHKDFLWYILRQREKKNEVSDDEVIMNAALFIVAGSETTATLLRGIMNQLLRNKAIFEKLKAEIRGSIKTADDLVMANLEKLPYMDACLEEALRIFPPVPVGLLRIVPEGGSMIDGHFIPAGVSIREC
ncbi:uncharacterized protein A1O5_12463 [Cladophialophora psammophila CBS 110553]|uniref:Cytochrome P450 oxidoreductase n=1 Tax=Cladophialophora psammophila CBS 110553 TaxID=1182543 RepID=W9VQ45_9EURO|nr:uncharacterized protein A1O5_12463 [Cladophialophora psammophila CBS 110553]EXJ57673.1 hypothetical protein A1O5_12463 [Cladophialophora psammophila CBS 110553]